MAENLPAKKLPANKDLAAEFLSLVDSAAELDEKSKKELLNQIFQQH